MNYKRLQPAIFWDRDGTLIEDRGHLGDPRAVEFFSFTFDALRRLQERYLFFIVTNQSGVAKGLIDVEDVRRVNEYVVARLAAAGISIAATYVCPHQREDGCQCIKPKPHFLLEAARQFAISLPDSYVVGDHPHDVEFAENAGARGIYVCTGHGLKHRHELHGTELVVSDIAAAADWILSQPVALRGGPRHGH